MGKAKVGQNPVSFAFLHDAQNLKRGLWIIKIGQLAHGFVQRVIV